MYLGGIQDFSKIPLRGDSMQFLSASREENAQQP